MFIASLGKKEGEIASSYFTTDKTETKYSTFALYISRKLLKQIVKFLFHENIYFVTMKCNCQ